MSSRWWLVLAFPVVLLIGSPALARVAVIETTAPLQDHNEQTVKSALKDAVQTAVKGAVAMGMSWFQIGKAFELEDMVTVQILATDKQPEGSQDGWQGAEPDVAPDQPVGQPL